MSHCDGCGRPLSEGSHEGCRARLAATDPPRFCVACGRKLKVQVLPRSWRAECVRCGPVAVSAGLNGSLELRSELPRCREEP